MEWIKCNEQQPTEGELVLTKIDDDDGERNVQHLKLMHNLWWHPDGQMYVYYSPTHWQPVKNPSE